MALERAKIPFTLHEYAHDPRNESYGTEASEALGVPAERVFKTLVAEVDGALVTGVVPVGGQLDLKALAAACGGKKATMASVAAAERTTGYVAGGISPVGQRKRLPVVVDASAMGFATVFCSGGRRGLEIELAPADLVRATGATMADIGRPPGLSRVDDQASDVGDHHGQGTDTGHAHDRTRPVDLRHPRRDPARQRQGQQHDHEGYGRSRRPGYQHHGQPGDHGSGRERRADPERIAKRIRLRYRRDAVLRLGVRRQRVVSSQLNRHLPGEAGGKTTGHVQLSELIEFFLGSGLELDSFPGQLTRLLVALGPEFGVLDSAHGERPGHEPGEPTEYEHARADARAGESLAYPSRGQDSVAGFRHMRAYPLDDPSRSSVHHRGLSRAQG
jgi:Cys-tRNA(Pro)/Cys-tRNA(Cys) deacylase